jgi:phosphatidylinositol alpha-1,6-mannosyltransferase
MPVGSDRGGRTLARWWFVTRKYPPAIGGMERLSYELTKRISVSRPTATVAMRGRASHLPVFIAAAGVRLLFGCVRRDIALVHLGDPVLAPLALILRAFGVPVAITLHGLDVVHASPAYRLWRSVFLRGFDAYVCISEATRAAAMKVGLPSERLHVIGIGIEPPAPVDPPARDEDCLLFVGRLVRRKGLAWFVREVLPELAANRPALRLVIVGDGPERAAIEADARTAGIEGRLVWAPRDDEEKARWLARATLCVVPNIRMPNDMEGFGIVALEAAAAGCPVLASDIEGLRDALVGGRAGTLLPPQDAMAWVRSIGEQLDDRAGRTQRAEAARAYVVRHCGWDGVVAAYERLLAATSARERGAALR